MPTKKLHCFFSMVQRAKNLHQDTIEDMRTTYGKRFLTAQIPFASDVERMGVHRAPVMVTARSGPAAQAYVTLCEELISRVFKT